MENLASLVATGVIPFLKYLKGQVMSRSNKFRAWDGKRMHYCGLGGYNDFIIDGGEVCVFGEFDLRERGNKDWPIMEYTGLMDSNRVEMCEGDIIQVPGAIATHKSIGEVLYVRGSYIISLGSSITDDYWTLGGFNELDVTIIGNIHETYHLLEDA